MKNMNGHHCYVFQTAEDARDAAKALRDGNVTFDAFTVTSMCVPREAEARLRVATVMVSGIGRNGELTGVPVPKCVDLWAGMSKCFGPDGIDIELDRRIERAIEDGQLERTKWKKERAA